MCCYYIYLQLLNKSSNFGSLKIRDQLVASHYIPSCGNICLYCIVQQHGCLLSNLLRGHAPQSKGDTVALPSWEDLK